MTGNGYPACTFCGVADGEPCVIVRPWADWSWPGRQYKNLQYVHQNRIEALRARTQT